MEVEEVMGQTLRNLARRWANPRLVAEADALRRRLIAAEAAAGRLSQERDRLTQERDREREQAARSAAVNTILADQLRTANASLSGTREQLRQANVERARAEQAAAECEQLRRNRRLA